MARARNRKGAEVLFWPLEDLKPYDRNARTHSDEQVEQIVASVLEFGWTNPVLADGDGGIVAGHGRCMAARVLYDRGEVIRFPGVGGEVLPEGTVPVIDCTGWSEEQRRAYVLADNQLALNADWDMELLGSELRALNKTGAIDLSVIGFDADELAEALRVKRGDLDPDADAPEPPETPVTMPGDLWICGGHRLLCGDCTNADDVDRLLDGATPHLMVTDPPYGVEYDPNWRNDAEQAGKSDVDWSKRGRAVGKVTNDDRADWSEAWALFPGDIAYVWHEAIHAGSVERSLLDNRLGVRAQIIWAKSHIAIGRGNYHWQHEPCWCAVRVGKTAKWQGDRKQSTLWQIAKPQKSETGHSTQKPVECMRRPMLNNSKAGDLVYEPFCGSGTTMIAAEMEGRKAPCMEVSPAHCDVIVRRWQDVSGKVATLNGRPYADVSGERLAA